MSRIYCLAFLLILSFNLYANPHALARSCSSDSSDHFYCERQRDDHSPNIYGPNLKVALTPFRLTDCTMFSVVGEGGSNNTRFSGTFGYFFSPKIRFKCTAEQLSQRVACHFTTGRSEQWIQQFAGGAAFEYVFCHPILESATIYGSYAHCLSRHLKTRDCCVRETNFLDRVSRHVSGGKDAFAGIGIKVIPWHLGTLSFAADYDYLTYSRKFSHNIYTRGFGGEVAWHQDFNYGLSLDLKSEIRRPFNYYEGAVNWTNVHSYGILTLGFYTGYTKGKDHLPDNWTTGLLISADFGGIPFFSRFTGCCEAPCVRGGQLTPHSPVDSELIAWVAAPAVRMPTVLAITEEVVTPTFEVCPPPPTPHPHPHPDCKAPISVPVPDQTSLPIDVSAFFDPNGHAIRFSAQGLPRGFFINPVTGIIRGDILEIGTIYVKVTGTTECGSTSEIFRIINQADPYDPYGPYGPYGPYTPYDPYIFDP